MRKTNDVKQHFPLIQQRLYGIYIAPRFGKVFSSRHIGRYLATRQGFKFLKMNKTIDQRKF